jgi:hypothetical protein
LREVRTIFVIVDVEQRLTRGEAAAVLKKDCFFSFWRYGVPRVATGGVISTLGASMMGCARSLELLIVKFR